MSEFRPYPRIKALAEKMYPPKPRSVPAPLPPQIEADAVEWVKGGCKGPAWSMIRPAGRPNLRPV